MNNDKKIEIKKFEKQVLVRLMDLTNQEKSYEVPAN